LIVGTGCESLPSTCGAFSSAQRVGPATRGRTGCSLPPVGRAVCAPGWATHLGGIRPAWLNRVSAPSRLPACTIAKTIPCAQRVGFPIKSRPSDAWNRACVLRSDSACRLCLRSPLCLVRTTVSSLESAGLGRPKRLALASKSPSKAVDPSRDPIARSPSRCGRGGRAWKGTLSLGSSVLRLAADRRSGAKTYDT
jgi:hypothetical protein